MTAQIKLDRAQEHIAEVGEIVDAWLTTDAFTIEPITDSGTGRTDCRVKLRDGLPDRLALVIGDAVHNLRVALDHAVFDVAVRAADGPLPESIEKVLMFPIYATQAKYLDLAPRSSWACRTRSSG